ncbi:MAG: ABC transporter permease [Verrucomicrobia bacterium]|nr:ABC transporter permease [Verrucomicrobiota bacterium]
MNQARTRRLTQTIRWELILAVLLLIAVTGGRILSPDFLTLANWTNLLANFVEIAFLTLPLTLIIITKEIDLSVASVLGLSSSLLGLLWQAGWPMPLVLICCLIAGGLAGLLNGFLIVQFRLPSLAVTIGTLTLFRGFSFVLLGDKAVADFPPEYSNLGFGTVGFLPIPFVVFGVLAVVTAVLVHATPFGRTLFAIGGNETAARFSGVRIRWTKLILFTLSGLTSALAGIVYTFRFMSSRADNGTGFELSALAVVFLGGVSVVGGKGTVGGVFLSLLLIGVIDNALTLVDVSNEVLTIVTGSLLIASIILPNLLSQLRERVRSRQGAAVRASMAQSVPQNPS